MKLPHEERMMVLRIAIGVILCCGVQTGVYFAIGKWTLAVLFGTLLGGAYAVFNFYLQARSLNKALEHGEMAAQMLRASHLPRMLGLAAMVVVAAVVPQIDPLAAVIPLLFPRVTILAMQLFWHAKPGAVPDAPEAHEDQKKEESTE